MLDSYRKKILDLVISRKNQSMIDEVGFFFEEFDPMDAEQGKIIDKNMSIRV